MSAREVLILNEGTSAVEVAQSGDTYVLVRDTHINGVLTLDTQLAIAQGGTGAATAVGARSNLEVYSTTEIDNLLAGQNEASEITYDPSDSSLSATNVKEAIDELKNNEYHLDAVSENFPGVGTVVAVSNIYEPYSESDWPDMMADKSWYDEEGYGVDGDWLGAVADDTAQNLLSPSQGDVCYHTANANFEKYSGSVWATTYRGPTRAPTARMIAIAGGAKLVVYDLTQSEPVMWMVFNTGIYCYIRDSITSIAMRGGVVIIGGASVGSAMFSFIDDKSIASILNSTATTGTYRVILPVSGRNNTEAANRIFDTSVIMTLAGDAGNNVTLTQLDNAPVDPVYGAKVVTGLIGTEGGSTFIKDDDTVIDVTSAAMVSVDIQSSGRNAMASTSNVYIFNEVPASDTTTASADLTLNSSSTPAIDGTIESVKWSGDELIIGTSTGVFTLTYNQTTPTESIIYKKTIVYESGFQIGDVELALSGNSLTDRSTAGTIVTDNGTATFAAVNSGDLQSTTASGGSLAATVTTGGECYGWEKISGIWTWRENIAAWVGISESGGTLTIADGTEFTLLCYTNTEGSSAQLANVEANEKPHFNLGAMHLLQGSDASIDSMAIDQYTGYLHVIAGGYYHVISQSGVIISYEATTATILEVSDGEVIKL